MAHWLSLKSLAYLRRSFFCITAPLYYFFPYWYSSNLIALLERTYPGVNALFDSPIREDGTQKWVDFAASFWHVDCVRGMGQSAFAQRYAKWCKQHGYQVRAGRAEKIYEGSKDLIAILPKDAMTKLLVKQAIGALNAVSKTLERLKAEMLKLAAQLPEFPVVMAMRGLGDSLGPQLMEEIGDVTRFAHGEPLHPSLVSIPAPISLAPIGP